MTRFLEKSFTVPAPRKQFGVERETSKKQKKDKGCAHVEQKFIGNRWVCKSCGAVVEG